MTNYWAGKRLLVTGGAGFLGNHIVEALRKQGCHDMFIVRSSEYDLTSEQYVLRLFSDLKSGKEGWSKSEHDRPVVDVVLHLAGLVGGIAANKSRPADFFYRNLLMGTLMLHHSWQNGVSKFVAAGAGCGYPEHASLPLREEDFWNGFPQPESAPYSLAKRLLHIQSQAYYQQYGFVSIIGIPGNVYGPYDNFDLEVSHVVPALVRKFCEGTANNAGQVTIWGTGAPSRDFVYAGDVARGLLLAAEHYQRPELVNLSSGTETTIAELAELLCSITGFKGRIVWESTRPNGQARRCFETSKAAKDLNFRAEVNLKDGLIRTVNWYRDNRRHARFAN